MNNQKGVVHALEMIPLFIAWMILLNGLWTQTSETLHRNENEWKNHLAQEESRMASDVLVHLSGEKPWEGCAEFSDEKKRVHEYAIRRSCILQLKDGAPAFISRVGLRTKEEDRIIFSRGDENHTNCAGVQTPILLAGESKIGILEVTACE